MPRAARPKDPEAVLRDLNGEQLEAVRILAGPVLVLAGAGSGKTRVLISRVLHLIHRRAAGPGEIVAITFTKKAAREMRARLSKAGGQGTREVTVATFHALGLGILQEQAERAGLRAGFGILGRHDQLSLLMGAARKGWPKNRKLEPEHLAQAIARLKEKGITPATCPEDTEDYGARLPRIYKGYERAKFEANLVDFEDLIRLPIGLLGDPAVQARYHGRWRHFLVDEFQDTNQAQLDLLRLLAGPGRNVCVVGDDDQSIYGWRGAELQNLLAFESHFPGPAVVKLLRNYRSTHHIIGASNAVIARNSLRREKTVIAAAGPGEPIRHHVADDEKSELEWLAQEIKDARGAYRIEWSDMAVLVRTNQQLRDLMDHFAVTGVPCVAKGAASLLDLPEIQMVLAYAKVMANPNDELSLAKVLRFPKRGFPKDLMAAVEAREDQPALEALEAHCAAAGAPWGEPLSALLALIRAKAEASARGFHAAFRSLLEEAGVLAAFPEGERRRENVERFLGLFEEEERGQPAARLAQVVNSILLDTQFQGGGEERPGVRLLTVHAAKGLEWDTVFLPSLDDDTFPSKNNHTDAGIEEERRLFYVAMTRAKRRLYLSWPATKLRYRVVRDVIPSRFVFEIPEEHMDGPIGKKDKEKKQVFLGDFFASIQATLGDEG